jgi:hypothetical protein
MGHSNGAEIGFHEQDIVARDVRSSERLHEVQLFQVGMTARQREGARA